MLVPIADMVLVLSIPCVTELVLWLSVSRNAHAVRRCYFHVVVFAFKNVSMAC